MNINDFTIVFFSIIIIGSFIGSVVVPKIYEMNR